MARGRWLATHGMVGCMPDGQSLHDTKRDAIASLCNDMRDCATGRLWPRFGVDLRQYGMTYNPAPYALECAGVEHVDNPEDVGLSSWDEATEFNECG